MTVIDVVKMGVTALNGMGIGAIFSGIAEKAVKPKGLEKIAVFVATTVTTGYVCSKLDPYTDEIIDGFVDEIKGISDGEDDEEEEYEEEEEE